jgi:hypothetical protein
MVYPKPSIKGKEKRMRSITYIARSAGVETVQKNSLSFTGHAHRIGWADFVYRTIQYNTCTLRRR